MKEVKGSTVGYGDRLQGVKKGWGCGYVTIPKGHPALARLLDADDSFFYYEVDNFTEQITFSATQKDGSYKIGFDTAHSWNDERQDELWVTEKVSELKASIEAYTIDDAKKLLEGKIARLNYEFENLVD